MISPTKEFFRYELVNHMTLYIAWILLYRFEMEWWWYGGAIVAYAGHVAFQIYLTRYEPKEPAPPLKPPA